MKRIILFMISISFTCSGFCQIGKGTGYLGGILGGSITKSEVPQGTSKYVYKSSGFNFNISYGHYISENVALGIGGGMNYNVYKNENTGTIVNSNKETVLLYFISPFVRVSKKVLNHFYCFGNLNLQAGTGPTRSTTTSSNSTSVTLNGTQTSYGVQLTGGLNYFLNRHFALMLTYGNLGYSNVTDEDDGVAGSETQSKTENLGVNFGLSSIGLGLQYFINNGEDKK